MPLLAALLLAACSKQEDGVVSLTARINPYHGGGGGKIQLDEGVARWSRSGEEQVNINGTDYPVVYTDAYTATISHIARSDDGYTALYPASAVRSAVAGTAAVTVRLDSVQPFRTVDGVQQVVAPMAAHTDGGSVSFANLGSVMRLAVSNTTADTIEMKYIRVSSSTALLSGTGRVAFDGTPSLTMTEGYHAVRLVFATGQERIPAGEARTYLLVLPPFGEADLQISLCANTMTSNYLWGKQNNSTSLPAGWVVAAPAASSGLTASTFEGEGTEESPYRIGNANDLAILANMVAGGSPHRTRHYRLTADIDCTTAPLQAIGTDEYPFAGTFDGDGHTITLREIAPFVGDRNVMYYGLFARTNGATIQNLTMSGELNLELMESYVVTSKLYLGSVVAYGEGGSVANCQNNVNVEISGLNFPSAVGGISGYSTCPHAFCTNRGNINILSRNGISAGGIVGHLNMPSPSVASQLVNHGNVTAERFSTDYGGEVSVGGVVGLVALATGRVSENSNYIVNSANEGTICATGEVLANDTLTACGGIVGKMATNGLVGNCYNNGDVKAIQNEYIPYASGIVGVWETVRPGMCNLDACLNNVVPLVLSDGGTTTSNGFGISVMWVHGSGKGRSNNCFYKTGGGALLNRNWTTSGAALPDEKAPQFLNTYNVAGKTTNYELYLPW